jgi:DNA repair exonuclease SbcCD nuclease subunit
MNSKVLIFSDLHCHCHKKQNKRLDDCLDVLNWVFKTAKEHEITNILFGGDLFHDRHKIDVYTYQKTFETLEDNLTKGDYKLYLLLGNHDIWYNEKTSVSSVIPLSSLPGVHIVGKPTRLKIDDANWDFIPFTHNPIESLEKLKNETGQPQYALGHIAVDGAVLHTNQHADISIEHDGEMVSINVGLFQHYKKVFLGHYHAEQRLNEIVEYIGSPLELNFGESEQEKHLIIFDCKTESQRYIVNDFSPKHIVADAEKIKTIDLKNNFVRAKVDDLSVVDLIGLKKELMQQGDIRGLEIKQYKKHTEQHVIEDAKSILSAGSDMFKKYIEQTGAKDLDIEKLINIGKKICSHIN